MHRAGGSSARYRPNRREREEQAPAAPLYVINPPLLQGLQVPLRRWIVEDWLPIGFTTLLYGDGGVGKSLLAQLLMTACATGIPWCGITVTRCRAFGFFCEDDADEIWRRQAMINEFFGLQFTDLPDMRWVSGVGEDNVLLRFESDGSPVKTPRFMALADEIKDFDAGLVVIDTASDTFGGNENDRGQVKQFVGGLLGGLAQQLGAAVLLNAHPSRSGLAAGGDLDGGSTGWSNAARSRWSLTRPAGEDVPKDTAERVLTKRKANYSTIGDEIPLFWTRGVFAARREEGGFVGAIKRQNIEIVFLSLLADATAQNRPMSDGNTAGNYAPKVFAKSPRAEGYGKRDFATAMERLFAIGRIRMENYGRVSDLRRRIVAIPPDEENGPDE